MIYNLAQYIRNNSSFTIYVNGWQKESNSDAIMIKDNGGETQNRGLHTNHTIQIKSRSRNSAQAKQDIDTVHALINNQYTLVMPSVTVNSVIYPAITLWRINSIQDPGYIGVNDNGVHEYSVNYIITTQSL